MALIFDSASQRASRCSPPFLVVADAETGLYFETSIDKLLAYQRDREAKSAFRGDHFSRACRGCADANPARRAIATTCGHVFCVPCASNAGRCPTCRVETRFMELKEEENYSRECRVCRNDEPLQRVILTSCAHTLCCCCALTLIPNAVAENRVNCPFCGTRSRMCFIVEEIAKTSRFRRIVKIVSRLIRKLFR